MIFMMLSVLPVPGYGRCLFAKPARPPARRRIEKSPCPDAPAKALADKGLI
jgi:hypothetical protein